MLFNNKLALELLYEQKFYELHSLLEDYWKLKKEGPEKLKIQALLQLVVSMHHKQTGNNKGFEILHKKASAKLGIASELLVNKTFEFLTKELELI